MNDAGRRLHTRGDDCAAARSGLEAIHLETRTADVEQGELDLDEPGADRTQPMEALETLNDRYGRNTVSIASGGVASDKRRFSMKRERKTPEYTIRWEDMPVAHA